MMNKWALITGGARRVGRYIAMHFAKSGYDILLHVNQSVSEGRALVSELQAKYPKQQFALISYDLVQWKQLDKFIRDKFDQYGLPELIIHNASYYQAGKLEETTEKIMDAMMAIHLYSPMIINREYQKLGGKGSIVNILDTAITTNKSSHAMYLLAKKSLAEYTKMAALEWAPCIRVNGVALGPVLPVDGIGDTYFNQVVQNTPLQKEVELSGVASTIEYFVSNQNVSGQIIYCDSAQHLL